MFSTAFESAFEHTLGLEGDYSNDPHDPGGETKFGISKRSYPHVDIAKLTLMDAKLLYYWDFWQRIGLDAIRGDVAAEIFDTAVNMGVVMAVRIVQRACNYFGAGLKVDGVFGPKTIAAIKNQASWDLLKVLNAIQLSEYIDIINDNPSQQRYAKGWLKRIQLTPEKEG